MRLSALSAFEPLARRALFIGSRRAAVYHWSGAETGAAYLFPAGAEGQGHFARYLRETAKAPFFALVDVFEEEYKHETIPHVFGADRAAIVERKAKRLFRDSPYYFHQLTGREKEGRRDDRILLTAVSKPEVIRPWIGLLEEAKTPLAGIGSLPLFSETILKQVEREPGPHRLIVSMQSISGLRQTYFHNGRFRLSRLAQLPRGGAADALWIKDEVEKIRRYLNSLRLLAAEESLQVYFLLAGELSLALQQEYPSPREQGALKCVFCDLNDLLRAAGGKRRLETPFSDRYFIHRLLQAGPVNCYASAADRRYYFMRRLRRGMKAGSVALSLAGAVWGAVNFGDGLAYRQGGRAAQQEADIYASRYHLARQSLPRTPVAAADLKIAVDLIAELKARKTTPLGMIQALSDGLRAFPAIKLRKLNWTAAAPAATPASEQDFDSYQTAILHGAITPFSGDYRAAIDLIDSFAETLRGRDNIHTVQILSLPLDVSPDSSLHGDAQDHARGRGGEADFSMRIVLGVKHDF